MTLAPADDDPRRQKVAGVGGLTPGPVVLQRRGDTPRALLERAGLHGGDATPVIVVCGGADELQGDARVVAGAVLGPAVRAAVARTHAAIVDGGTDSGVMSLLGAQRARDPDSMPVLLGVAPEGKVAHGAATGADRTALAPDHTHFVLADSAEWGGETALLTALAAELACGAPVVMVVAGGGAGARAEVREAVARGWPVFAIAGTGGVADEIAPKPQPSGTLRRRLGELGGPLLERVHLRRPQPRGELAGADVRRAAGDDPDGLARTLAWELQASPTLKRAWAMFATYDGHAVVLRRTFERYQRWTLILGVAATVIALAYAEVTRDDVKDVLHWGAVAMPLVVSTLVALANRRGAGKRWILLRAAAEAVKSEIYRYRTRTGLYSSAALADDDAPDPRAARLAERLATIDGGLNQTAASNGPITPYAGELPPKMYGAEGRDDGLSDLDARGYVAIRVTDQLSYYRSKVARLDRLRAKLQLLTLVAGAVGSVIAAAGAEIWVGATTALAGAALAHLGYLQVDNTIVTYNQAASQLDALQRDIEASSPSVADISAVVERGETVLTTELGGWVQQMNDALAEWQAKHPAAEKAEES